MHPLLGSDRFADRYAVQAVLGEGTMGVVLRVLDLAIGEDVALKLLRPTAMRADEAVERLRREVRLTRRITHANVIRIHDIGEWSEQHYLTMQLVKGESLDRVLQRGGASARPDVVLRLVDQICAGLEAAHRAGVIHRDLKPSNVLVESSERDDTPDPGARRVVVTDFGIARPIGPEVDGVATDGVLGTPYYMAPEQLACEPIDGRTDVYALGCILFELTTGQLPFSGKHPLEVALERLQRPARDPRELRPMPDALATLINRCLAREPGQRPADMTAVRAMLHDCLVLGDELPTIPIRRRAVQSETAPYGQRPHRSRRPAAARPISPTRLAVPLFSYAGRRSGEHLAEALTDELLELLEATPNVQLIGRETGSADSEPDDQAQRQTVELDAVVSGRLELARGRARVQLRLLDARNGLELWREKLSTQLSSLISLEFSDAAGEGDASIDDERAIGRRLARRAAETLRNELISRSRRRRWPIEAYDLYRRGIRRVRRLRFHGESGAASDLEASLRIAPDFTPAIAGMAIASVQRWFDDDLAGVDVSKHGVDLARAAVERALSEASEEPDSHLAAAMLACHDGRYADALEALGRALHLAPVNPGALAYLGMLECEAGKTDSGLALLSCAHDVQPDLVPALLHPARTLGLLGEHERAERWVLLSERVGLQNNSALLINQIRIATWRGQLDRVERITERIRRGDGDLSRLPLLLGRAWLGKLSVDEVAGWVRQFNIRMINRRSHSVFCQLAAEFFCAHDRPEIALEMLEQGALGVMLNLLWIDRCPLIEPLRAEPKFAELRARVEQRGRPILER